jgi:hypothetical protein
MPRIYLTYRPEDSTRNEVERIYERMAARYGTENILRTATGGNADAAYLADLVNDCDALIVVIGRFWLAMLTEDGRRVIDDPDDYQHIELMTALAREDMWVTVVFTDGAHVPKSEELPPDLQSLLQRDRLEASTLELLDKELASLETRIGFAEVEDGKPNMREAQRVHERKAREAIEHVPQRQSPTPRNTKDEGCRTAFAAALVSITIISLFAIFTYIKSHPANSPKRPTPTNAFRAYNVLPGQPTFTPVPVILTPTPRPTVMPFPSRTPRPTRTPTPTRTLAPILNKHPSNANTWCVFNKCVFNCCISSDNA